MKVIGIIQARMNSKRLPGKTMLEISGKPVIQHIFDRLSSCKKLQSVVISTGPYKQNSEIFDYAENHHIPIFTGEEIDLIDRFYKTALKFKATAIVRITGDCPLVDPQIVDKMVTIYEQNISKYDIITNCQKHSFPHGLDIEIFSFDVIKKLWEEVDELEYREWFTLFIKKNFESFKIYNLENRINLSDLRLTLDYEEDFELIKKIFENFNSNLFYLNDIVELFERYPEMKKINEVYQNHRNIDAPR